jgi:hypothetical protein
MKPRTRTPVLDEKEAAAVGPRILKDPQSVAYAWQTVSLLKGVYGRREASLRDWAAVLDDAERYKIYDRIPPAKPYGSMDAMLKAEIGVGVEEATKNKAQQMAADPGVEPLADEPGNPTGANQHSDRNGSVTTIPDRGAKYRVRRLKRDRPDLNARVASGELSLPDAEQAGQCPPLPLLDVRGQAPFAPPEGRLQRPPR